MIKFSTISTQSTLRHAIFVYIKQGKLRGKQCKGRYSGVLERVAITPKAKRHSQELIHPKGGDDGGLLDVLQRHRYLIVSFLEVQLGEPSRTGNPPGKISNVGQRVMVPVTVFNQQ